VEPQFEFLGSLKEGLANFRENDRYGFIDADGNIAIEPRFEWVGEFSEGLCPVRRTSEAGFGQFGYIDKTESSRSTAGINTHWSSGTARPKLRWTVPGAISTNSETA
jgi:hypothetical protein